MTNQRAELTWKGGVPIATAFDDPYYSLDNGLGETAYVFLGGNDLPARFSGAWAAAGSPGHLQFTSFEAFPMDVADMRAALDAFPELTPFATALLDQWDPGTGPVKIAGNLTLHVIIGDARITVPAWDGTVVGT